MKHILGRDVAEQQFSEICEELGIDESIFDDDKSSKDKIITSIMSGRLEYEDGKFKQVLISPIKNGEKLISFIEITEPTGNQLREMASVKKKNDDVGKGMAVLGAVTGHGLLIINKMRSRDLMVSVGVIGLFL